jgi:serine/threonine protein kinase
MADGDEPTGVHIGTTRYLAPELVIGEIFVHPTLASDVYALGCVGLKVSSPIEQSLSPILR